MYKELVVAFIVLAIVLIPIGLGMLISFLLPAVPLFKMAQKAGYNKPWLAFVPFAQVYLEFILPRRRYKALFIHTHKRGLMSLITILLVYIIPFFAVNVMAYFHVPYIWVRFFGICISVCVLPIYWRKRYDILYTFGDKGSALPISIISLWIPVLYAVFLFINMNKAPDYGEGNFYNVDIPTTDFENPLSPLENPLLRNSNEESVFKDSDSD